jgi:hypothetical protein
MWYFLFRKVAPINKITYTNEKYYDLMKNIRNGLSLSKEDIVYIRELPTENLVEIIIIYDKLVKLYTDEL